jgi:hypothetical protein
MAIELDHIFICCSVDAAEEAACLTAFGLTEGGANTHPGQGTACRRFFFHNAYLKLLWVCDSTEGQSETTRPTRLWERWTHRGDRACPFAFIFRPKSTGASPPFATWDYHPSYLPEPLSIQVGKNCEVLTEPMMFYFPFALGRRPDNQSEPKRQPLEHAAGFHEITHVELVTPSTNSLSPEFHSLIDSKLLCIREGAGPLLMLGFDGQARDKHADFRPVLPLIFKW